MKYGYFDDDRRAYVVETPRTPYPWINYLGNDRFFSLISHTGGGYSFYRDARLRRLTRFRYNNVPADSGGRCFYIHEAGCTWCPAWIPMKSPLEQWSCRHGLGHTVISSLYDGIFCELTFLVPIGHDAEVQRVKITNRSSTRRTLRIFSLVEWCLWNALDDMTNFQRNLSTGEVEVRGSMLVHKTEYRERRNHFAYYAVNQPLAGFDTDREAFLGPGNGFHEPAAAMEGVSRNSIASGWSPIASHGVDVTLEPGGEQTLVYVLGYAENPQDQKFLPDGSVNTGPADATVAAFDTDSKVEQALDSLATYWENLLARQSVHSPDEKFNRMINCWNPYQCMITYHFSRSASYFESGIGRGMGFRDSNQDLLGVVHMVPERARTRLLDIAATQLSDGGAYHQYQPLTKRGNADVGDNFNDDPLWLILSVCAYIRETGDAGILDASVPYENDVSLAAPMLDHLFRSFRFTLDNRGPHGLPLIGRADWNDCLNLNCHSMDPDESFQTGGQKGGKVAESLMIAGLFCTACRDFADLLSFIGDDHAAEKVRSERSGMLQAIVKHGRDPAWYLRAYDSSGRKLGSAENENGRIFIESQGWCIMGGAGMDDGFARTALDSVRKHLDTEHGIMILQPAFKEYHPELGEVSSYPPGYKENAGIFCHNNPWIIIAEALLGNNEQAFAYYRKICPAYREEIGDLHRTEPYVYAQMIAGRDAVRHGEAKNSWLTGTAAWNYFAATHYLLGIRPGWEGLVVHPCLPEALLPLTLVRVCRDVTFHIEVSRALEAEAPGVFVDGKRLPENVVPYPAAGGSVHVVVKCAAAPR